MKTTIEQFKKPLKHRQICAYCFKDQRAVDYQFANGSLVRCDLCWLRKYMWLPWWSVAA
jgi:hypothetical protein